MDKMQNTISGGSGANVLAKRDRFLIPVLRLTTYVHVLTGSSSVSHVLNPFPFIIIACDNNLRQYSHVARLKIVKIADGGMF